MIHRMSCEEPDRPASGPLTVEQSIQEALAASPELEQIRSRIQGAAEMADQAASSYYPRLIISEEYNRTDNPVYGMMHIINQRRLRSNTDFNDPGWQQNWATRARGEWTIFDMGGRSSQESAASNQQYSTESELRAARNNLVGAVTETYYRWIQAIEFIRVAEIALAEAESNLALGEARVQAEAALESERLRLKTRTAEAESNLVSAKTSARRLQAGLERLLARRIDGDEIPDPSVDAILPCLETEEQELLLEKALSQRPEIASVAYLIRSARDRIRSAESGLWPEVSVFAQYELNSEHLSEFENSWMLGAQVAYPLFEGGLSRSRIREAEARIRAIEAQGEQIALDIALEVTHASLAVQEAKERIRVAAKREEWAAAALKETRKQYEMEVVTVDALLQADLEKNRAEVSHRSALFDGRIALVLLKQALGDFADWVEGSP
ncbi:MAG: TolC family protein [Planctomycetes bacterium]|nr:TolC family protein [Planctomycetota bacterium]